MKKQTNLMNRLTEEGIQLRIAVERKFLNRLIDDIPDDETTLEQVCKALQAYCDLIKQDIAAEKNEVISNRTPNSSRSQPNSLQKLDQAARAPYGLSSEGTPLSLAEFRNAVARPIAGLYGLSDTVSTPLDVSLGSNYETKQAATNSIAHRRNSCSDSNLDEETPQSQQLAKNPTG